MFGATVDQLPEIWRRLVDGGMESGQAYGKSLRTVKSCVGSDWCRYGQQDSVQLAIDLELRYRGLRSPHKIKMGVSGCARECAEARGKGRRRDRHRQGVEPLRQRQRRYDPAPRAVAGRRPRHRDADPLYRPLPHVLHPHRRAPRAHRAVDGAHRGWARPHPRGRRRRQPRPGPRFRGRRWPATSRATRASGRASWTTRTSCRASCPSSTPRHPGPDGELRREQRPQVPVLLGTPAMPVSQK